MPPAVHFPAICSSARMFSTSSSSSAGCRRFFFLWASTLKWAKSVGPRQKRLVRAILAEFLPQRHHATPGRRPGLDPHLVEEYRYTDKYFDCVAASRRMNSFASGEPRSMAFTMADIIAKPLTTHDK